MKTMDKAMEPSTVTLPSELTTTKVNLLSSVATSLPSKDTALLCVMMHIDFIYQSMYERCTDDGDTV